jgi:hypothetical protein
VKVDALYELALPKVKHTVRRLTSWRHNRIVPMAIDEDQKSLEQCLEQILGVTVAIMLEMKAAPVPTAKSAGGILLLAKHRAVYGQKMTEILQTKIRKLGNLSVPEAFHLIACLSYTSILIQRVLRQRDVLVRYFHQLSKHEVCHNFTNGSNVLKANTSGQGARSTAHGKN